MIGAAALAAVTGDAFVQESSSVPSVTELRTMTARFAPAEIRADVSTLPANERQALGKLIDAARLMDGLFLRQVWAGNDAMLQQLAHDVASGSSRTTTGPAQPAAPGPAGPPLIDRPRKPDSTTS